MRRDLILPLFLTLSACSRPDTAITRLTPDLAVAPETFAFGDVVRDFTVEKTVQVVNAGRAPLDISAIYLTNENVGFTLDGADTVELSPDESISIRLAFTPTNLGAYGTNLVIESNDDEAPVLELPMSGSGVIGPQPDIELSVTSVDFGTGTEGIEGPPEFISVGNVGDGPLTVSATEQGGSGAFRISATLSNQIIPAGSESTLIVTYTPDAVLSGHTGTITFYSDDPDEPEVTVTLSGGDGEAYEYPIANIVGEDTVNPPEDVVLDGTGSIDPMDTNDEYDLTYSWSVIDQPDDSNARFDDVGLATPELLVDIAGSYIVQLIVTDYNGVASAPATHAIEAEPVEDLYIALAWDKNQADVDLHVVPTGRSYFSRKDASFCNTSPNWGGDGYGEHSGDVSAGFGPESVEIGGMSDTEYHIAVHYFEDNGGSVTNATITIYVQGEPHETISHLLGHNDFWEVGYMHVQSGVAGFVEADEATYSSTIRECEE